MTSGKSPCCDSAESSPPKGCMPSSRCSKGTVAGALNAGDGPLVHFQNMIGNCLDYARAAHAAGRPIVGILCEYTPRELILAAGGVPVCLCGGSSETIPAAEKELPANLCPLIKSTYGYHVEKSNPFLEMADLILAETTCDGKKKMYELLGKHRSMYVLELPQREDDPDAYAHWVAELRKCKAFLESRYSVNITPERLRASIVTMNRERQLRRALAEQMKSEAPPLTGRELILFKSSISGIPEDLVQYENALVWCGKKDKACFRVGGWTVGSHLRDRVRVLMTGSPMVHGAERVLDLVESHGGLVACMENCSGLKPILEDVAPDAPDPILALADKYIHIPCSVMTPNRRRFQVLAQLAREYRAQCIVDFVLHACLTYSVESARLKRFSEEELGLPYLCIETDYAPADSARIAVRVEALFEMVRSRRPKS